MLKKICSFFFIFLLCRAGNAITLINDSNIVLKVVIQDTMGQFMDENMIDPGSTTTWSLNAKYYKYQSQPSKPKIPFTVIWYCLSGAVYATCSNVPLDGYIRVSSCSGAHQCYYP